jgi:predicted RNase H-like HicB family nuclease
VPGLPSVAAQDETIEEGNRDAKAAIQAYLKVMHEDCLPTPTIYRSQRRGFYAV